MGKNNLFTFEWPVDQDGYELEFVKPRLTKGRADTKLTGPYQILKRRSGPLRYYRPLEDQPGLARRLAELSKHQGDESLLVDFANEFGLLSHDSFGLVISGQRMKTSDWWEIALQLHFVLELKDAGNIEAACATLNEHVHPNFKPHIHFQQPKRPKLSIAPDNLAGALWFQVMGEITHGTKFKRCDLCPTWFPVGPRTGHRETRRFCSNTCRNAWHRQNKKTTK